MLLDDPRIDRDTETRVGRYREVAIDHLRVSRDGSFDPRLREVVEVALGLEVRHECHNLKRGCSRDWTPNIVWGDEHPVSLRPRCDPTGFGNSAAHRDIRPHDVDRTLLEELSKIQTGMNALTTCDRDVAALGNLRQQVRVLRSHRLL